MTVTELLLASLNNPVPAARIEMLRVLATLEETLALPTLRNLINSETDPDVLPVLKWAGKVIWQAQQNGYSTANAIHKHFRRDLELSPEEKQEAAKLANLQQNLDVELMKERQDAQVRNVGTTLALGALGAMVGGVGMGASIIMAGANGATNNPDSGLVARPKIGTEAIPPQRPTEVNIAVWLRRLKDAEAKHRKAALTELGSLNNPAALPHIAAVFATESDPQVKEAAQRAAKIIYYNWYAWEAENANQPQKNAASTSPAQSDVSAILAKAQAAKDAKKRKTLS
ncbi:MAG: HEAT repeat domain-containing protein [Chloroflexota bacterium]